MKLLLKILGSLYHTFFGVFKNYTVNELSHDNLDTTTVVIKTVNGVSITFYCKKYNYVINNHSSWVPDYYFYNYELSGVCDENSSEKLKNALNKIVYFPMLGSFFVKEYSRRKFFIEAYIDLLNNDIKKNNY